MNSPVRLGVSLDAATPTGFFFFSVRGFEALFLHAWVLACMVCLAPLFFLSVYLHRNVGLPGPAVAASNGLPVTALLGILPASAVHLCPSYWSGWMFNSLVVRLTHSSIFWQFWLFFVFKFVVVLLLLCKESQCIYLCLHLGQKSDLCLILQHDRKSCGNKTILHILPYITGIKKGLRLHMFFFPSYYKPQHMCLSHLRLL